MYDTMKHPYEHGRVHKFAIDPLQLPEAVYAAAYKDDPPVTKNLPGFHQLIEHIPLRSNSQLLIKEAQALNLIHCGQSAGASNVVTWDELRRQMQCGQLQGGNTIPGFQIYDRPRLQQSPPPAGAALTNVGAIADAGARFDSGESIVPMMPQSPAAIGHHGMADFFPPRLRLAPAQYHFP